MTKAKILDTFQALFSREGLIRFYLIYFKDIPQLEIAKAIPDVEAGKASIIGRRIIKDRKEWTRLRKQLKSISIPILRLTHESRKNQVS